MPTDHERDLNRAKQKRFRARHPGYYGEREKERQAKRLPQLHCTGNYRTFELCDPYDPEKFPRIVGYCRFALDPVWANLWKVRRYSKSKWAQWFRALEKMGLEPEERPSPWSVGVSFPVNRTVALYALQSRIRRLEKIAGADSCWFLRRNTFSRVAYLTPQTGVVRFRSVAQAARETENCSETIRDYVAEVKTVDGRTWFDED